jgi:excisionase family DNA binding protein
MGELLTVKELQELLKIDRLTVYRMLKDGRLTGVKVGHQWRFSQEEIDALVFGGPARQRDTASAVTPQDLPIHCAQMIQDVFSEIAQVAAVTVGPDGEPLTGVSNSCAFCNLIPRRASIRRRPR